MVQLTKLKRDAIVGNIQLALDRIDRAQYVRKLMDDMSTPADVACLAAEISAQLDFVYDRLDDAKAQLTV